MTTDCTDYTDEKMDSATQFTATTKTLSCRYVVDNL